MDANKLGLLGKLCGLGGTITEAMNEIEGFVPCGHPAAVVLEALEVCGDPLATELKVTEETETVQGFIEHVSEHRGVSAHAGRTGELSAEEAALADALVAKAPEVDAADPDKAQVIYRALAAIDAADVEKVALYTPAIAEL